MRTRQELLRAGAVLLALFLLSVLFLSLYFDRAATGAVNRWLSSSFNFPAGVRKVKLNIWSGNVEVTGLRIESPPGFAHREFLTLRTAEMDLRFSSLWAEEIVADSVRADGLIVRLENIEGRRNAREIFQQGGMKEGKDNVGRRFRIRRLVLVNTLLTYPVAGGEQVAAVDRMEIEEPLGKEKSALLKEAIARMVARSVREGAGQAAERALAGSLPPAREGAGRPEGPAKAAAGKRGKISGERGR